MKWASSLSVSAHLERAVDEAAARLAGQLAGEEPDLVLAFVSAHHAEAWESLPRLVSARFPRSLLVGCSAGGVIGGGREVEREASLSLTGAAMPGVRLSPFHLEAPALPDAAAGEAAWREVFNVLPEHDPQFLLLADPFTFPAEQLLRGLDVAFPAATKLGGLASGGRAPGRNALFLGPDVHTGGAIGVALTGNVRVDTIVAQGCRPVGQPMFVTRSRRNVIFQLDGRPATQVIEDVYASLAPEEQELFRQSLFLGVVMKESEQVYRHGDFLVRNLVGVDPDAGALAVAATVKDGDVVQFHVRDAQTSASDLDTMLTRFRDSAGSKPTGALLFSCLGRGVGLYGEPDHDSKAVRAHLGELAVGGFFCNGEIGPVQGRTFLHGYTSCVGLFSSRD